LFISPFFIKLAIHTFLMLYPLVAVFVAAAYFDYKEFRIPDYISAIGWLMLGFAWYIYADSAPLLIAGASFAIIYPLNSLIALRGKVLMAWGDILLIPVYVAYASGSPSFIVFLFAPLAAMGLYRITSSKDKRVSLAPFLAFGVLTSLLAA
jgi:hypothetical protein